MHKDLYAGGFLFHPLSEQILLQKYNSDSGTPSPWILFGEISIDLDNPAEMFKDIIYKLLDIKIDLVYPVYSYTKENIDKSQHIVYSEVENMQNFPAKNGLTFAWFTFKEVIKLQAAEQTKHDIVVGKRVIEAATRKRLGLHTFQ